MDTRSSNLCCSNVNCTSFNHTRDLMSSQSLEREIMDWISIASSSKAKVLKGYFKNMVTSNEIMVFANVRW